MPSVFTVDGPTCPWVLKKGKSFKGCYQSERAARRAARGGWSVMYSRPPGVSMRGLGSAEKDHTQRAKKLLQDAWTDLERMPQTCYGGILMAARAKGYVERASAHLNAIVDRATRKRINNLYGSRNYASRAIQETIQFYASVCDAPYSKVDDRPLFSRAKMARELKRHR